MACFVSPGNYMIKGRREINARFPSYTKILKFDFLQNQQIDVAFNTGLVYKTSPQSAIAILQQQGGSIFPVISRKNKV
jgi:hypothetical protein